MKTRKSQHDRLSIRLEIGITPSMDTQLSAVCRRLGEDRPTVIRAALREYFEHRLPPPQPEVH